MGQIPGLGRSLGEGKGNSFQCSGLENSTDCIAHGVSKSRMQLSGFHLLLGTKGFPASSDSKESACNAGDLGSIPGLGRSPGDGKGYPLQYSGLENSMDCIVHGVANNRTRLSDFHFDFVNVLQLLLSTTLWYTTGISAVCYCKITQNLWWYSSVQVWLSIKQLQCTHPYDKLLTMVRVGLPKIILQIKWSNSFLINSCIYFCPC